MIFAPTYLRSDLLIVWRIWVLFLLKTTSSNARNIGQFFHLTDLHLDANYSEFGDLTRWCHAFQNGKKGPNIGRFGNHNFGNIRIYCDSSWDLVKAAFFGMKSVLAEPDYIFWTGDNLPHVPDEMYSAEEVVSTMQNLTDMLRETFPDVQVYPVLGNHDYWESSQFPGHSNPVYRASAVMWADWIGYTSTMGEGGFYRAEVGPGLSLLGLNTNLYYYKNRLQLSADPGGQLAWLDKELSQAEDDGRRVILIGHIPPGSYERRANISWFQPEYNEAYLRLLRRYPKPILHQFFGHNHIDSFRVIYDEEGDPVGSILIAPSVCPGRSNNPSFRVVDYDRDTWELIDIRQYFVDLRAANELGRVDWALEYSFSEAYGLSPITTSGLASLLEALPTSPALYERFYAHNSALLHPGPCENDCARTFLCAVQHVDYPEYWRCLGTAEEDGLVEMGLLMVLGLGGLLLLLSRRENHLP